MILEQAPGDGKGGEIYRSDPQSGPDHSSVGCTLRASVPRGMSVLLTTAVPSVGGGENSGDGAGGAVPSVYLGEEGELSREQGGISEPFQNTGVSDRDQQLRSATISPHPTQPKKQTCSPTPFGQPPHLVGLSLGVCAQR